MRHRWTRLAILAAMGALLALPATASADAPATEPTLTLVRDCSNPYEYGSNGLAVILTGFPPFTSFTVILDDTTFRGDVLITDENGYFNSHPGDRVLFGTFSNSPLFATVTIIWEGGTLTDSLYVDCSEPASKKDCDHGEWRRYDRFDFKSQGKCIAWVRKNPEPVP